MSTVGSQLGSQIHTNVRKKQEDIINLWTTLKGTHENDDSECTMRGDSGRSLWSIWMTQMIQIGFR